MSIITAYKSDIDNKIFEKKEDYIKHLKRIAKKKLFSKSVNYLEKKNREFNKKLKEIKSFDELSEFVIFNQTLLIKNGIYHNFKSYKLGVRLDTLIDDKNYKIIEFKFSSPVWSNDVSTSHNSPKDKTDTIYSKFSSQPGWLSNLFITIEDNKTTNGVHLFPELLKETPLNTGSGGSSDGIHYKYNVKLFAIDFPELIIPSLIKDLKDNNDNLNYFETKERIDVIKNILPQKYNINDLDLLTLVDTLMIYDKQNSTELLEELIKNDMKEKNIYEAKKIKI